MCVLACFKLKRKKQAVPEKPVKKQKPGETSRALASSKQSSSSRDDNMFQVESEGTESSGQILI